MATTPKITTIANYVKDTTLPLINATGDYALSLANGIISRDYMNPDDVQASQLPAAFILTDGPNAWTPMTANEYATGTDSQDITTGYVLRIIGYVNLADPGDVQTTGALTDKMNQFISDIIIALHSDRSLGGNVTCVTLIGSDTSLEMWADQDRANYGIIEVWFALKYSINPDQGRA